MNKIDTMSDSALQNLAGQMNTVLKTSAASYGVSTTQATNLDGDNTNFGTSLTNVTAKKAAAKAAVQGKDAYRAELLDSISVIANVIYNNPAVTDEMIAALGLQPRAKTKSKITPKTPGTLTASPYPDGNVFLKWGRGDNPYGVIYVVETSTDGSTWTQIGSATATKLTVSGYAPGVGTWFRVRATRNGLSSPASNLAPIYVPGGGAGFLSVAA